jgi:hypothetical protein
MVFATGMLIPPAAPPAAPAVPPVGAPAPAPPGAALPELGHAVSAALFGAPDALAVLAAFDEHAAAVIATAPAIATKAPTLDLAT